MNAIATPTAAATTVVDGAGPKVTQRRLVRAEWIKFRSVRSLVITLCTAALAMVLLGVVFSASVSSGQAPRGPGQTATDPLSISLGATSLVQLIVGVLGVLVVTSEYSTGLIRTFFGAVGTRLGVLRAKVAVVGTSVASVMAVAVTAAVLLGQSVYNGHAATVGLTDPGVARAILGAVVYLGGIAVIGVALGFILRSTAAAIGTLVGGVFIIPTLASLLPDSISHHIVKFLPSKAGESMMSLTTGSSLLSSGTAFAVFAAWVVGLVGLAAYLVRRRDA